MFTNYNYLAKLIFWMDNLNNNNYKMNGSDHQCELDNRNTSSLEGMSPTHHFIEFKVIYLI